MMKKITDKQWRSLLPRYQNRARRGLQTQIIFNDRVVDEERISRELARRNSLESMRSDFALRKSCSIVCRS